MSTLKTVLRRLLGIAVCVAVGLYFGWQHTPHSLLIADTTTSPTPSENITPTPANTSGGGFGGNSNALPPPTPTLTLASPFVYAPLPTNPGEPEDDIVEVSPLTANRISAQVDDYITFTATIKNQAPYAKVIYNLCFESTDGNFGCVFNIHLASGQSYSIQNVGSWKTTGQKQIWLQWTQDNYNIYRPVGEIPVSVTITD